jgi:hypothetical protein
LPDGSHFEMHYDATKSQWTGILTVPKPGGEPAKFTGSGSGLFPLLIKLDRQYRATLEPAKQETPPSEATPPASTVAEASPTRVSGGEQNLRPLTRGGSLGWLSL